MKKFWSHISNGNYSVGTTGQTVYIYDENGNEIGFKKMPDGTYLVSMACPMLEITVKMIDWWFWWHPQAKERYQVWFLSEYIEIFVKFFLYYMENINDFLHS